MFSKQIRITGIHGDYLRKYSKDKQGENTQYFTLDDNEGHMGNYYIFENILQCFMCAAMIGIIEGKLAAPDNSKTTPANIFADIVNKNYDNLMRIYQHMILTRDLDLSIDARIKKAFSVDKSNEDAEEERIYSYARGGLEIINDYFKDCKTFEDVANAIVELSDKYSINMND